MTLEVEIISQEIIKPSSPTPDHVRHYKLSFLDQTTAPQMYSFFIIFFEFNGETQPSITKISNKLKKSLAEVLTLFYPLAGRAHYNMYIDCNDQGIPFLEAHIHNCKLSDIFCNPIPDELPKLVPFELADGDNNIPFGVQLNAFKCGGFAIGQCVSHKIADGLSMLMFSRAWTATTRRSLGDQQVEIQLPKFASATLFPPKLFAQTSIALAKNKLVTKRFVFDASNIEHLRAKYVGLECPTRIETLSAFIWSRFVAINKEDAIHEHQKLHKVIQVVNLRRRFDPPLPPHYFGNLITFANLTPSLLNTGEECYGLAKQIREAIKKIDKVYIKKLQEGVDDHMISDNSITSVFTSLCNFSLYDNDFGWGRPSWVSLGMPRLDFNNVVIFVDTRDADGIEAYITSAEQVLTKLESDTEFLRYVYPSWVSSSLNLTHQPTTIGNINAQNRPTMMKKPSFQAKPLAWASGLVKLTGLALKVFKKR